MSDARLDIKGNIFNIQKFSVQDGPGVRTVVFFKGCPLRCKWCCNPESQIITPALLYDKKRCLGCQRCVNECPKHAIKKVEYQEIDRNLCDLCGKCAEKCYVGALEIKGENKSVRDVLKDIYRDKEIYRNSGGGVTLSGGEALMQPEFAQAILSMCKEDYIHTAIETCGYAKWEDIQRLMPYIDLFLFDIKHMDENKHKEGTGVSNKLILDNLKRIAGAGKQVIARLPIIPNYNNDPGNIEMVARFLKENNVSEAHVLPFHKLGLNKYESMDIEYSYKNAETLSDENIELIQSILKISGINVRVYNH